MLLLGPLQVTMVILADLRTAPASPANIDRFLKYLKSFDDVNVHEFQTTTKSKSKPAGTNTTPGAVDPAFPTVDDAPEQGDIATDDDTADVTQFASRMSPAMVLSTRQQHLL